MVTKTKPKNPATLDDLKVKQISINDSDLIELAECCGMDNLDIDYKEKIESLRLEINPVLTIHAHTLMLSHFSPSPANIKAHLEPILTTANKLSELLNPDDLAKEVLCVLPELSGLRNQLWAIIENASNAITSIEGEQSRGVHNKATSQRYEVAKHDVLVVFNNQTIRDYTGDKTGELDDRNEFEKICKKYITAYTPPQY